MAELPQKHRVSVSGVLKILGVSRSGYRAWKQRVPSVSEKHRDHIKDAIKQIYDGSHQNYGAPKITEMLHRQGESIAEKTVGNYMRQMGIKAQWVKPYTVTTIDSDFNSELQNILDEQFNPSRPDAVWVSDITYIWTYNGFVYLTSIMDLYSRKIIAWVLSQSLEAIHVVECVNKAKQMRNVTSPLVFHSDRGIQFVSQAFQKVTEGMINSYSKKAYPWDNACIESFHSLLKREWLNRFKIFDYKHAYRLVFEYIETFYNTVRIHSHCGYLSPDEYEKQYRNKLLELEQKLQNILDEQFNPSRPDAVWVSDITYIWTYNGFVYLTSIMDLYSRKIIAWVLSQSLEAIHVVECVNKAKQMRNVTSPLVFHSDRGIQFVSQAFQKVTEGMINSYSKKAYPWDNACIESFHSLLKREWLNRFKIFDYKHAYRLVFEYIETFYNTVRIHSHCGYLSPDEYEKQYRNKLLELEQKLAG